MSAGLVVELERLVAEAGLCRSRLAEIARALESCRHRLGAGADVGSAAAPVPESARRAAVDDSAPLEFDPTWGTGPE